MNKTQNSIPARSPPGLSRAAPPVSHQGDGEKCATDAPKQLRGKDLISIATWNVRTLAQIGKLQELTNGLKGYTWHVVGLCEVRWKNAGEHTTEDHHMLYHSGENDKHANGVGFLINKDIKDSVLGCHPISGRLISIRLKAKPFNITIIQAYAPTTGYSDDQVEEFYTQLQETIDEVDKKDILIIQGDWNAKVGAKALADWKNYCGPSCNETTNERGLRLLEFASYNNMVLANTLGVHKASRRWTWHAPNGSHHQIDYIMVQNRFRSGISRAKTRTYPGADMGSDHDLVILNFKVRLKKITQTKNTRLKFNLEKLKDSTILESFQATIGGKFAAFLTLEEDTEVLTTKFNTVMTETAGEILGKHRYKTRPWVTDEILDMCDSRKELKKTKGTTKGALAYKKINKNIRNCMTKAKEDWINKLCISVEDSLSKNNSKKAFQIVKDLTKQKTPRVSAIHDKDGRCLTENKHILDRWTEYCSDLYNHKNNGDINVLTSLESTNDDDHPILREEVEKAIKTLKTGKAAGVDNIPAELIKHGGTTLTDILTQICNKIWQTGEWPSTWTQSLIITLPKKGNLQLCQNYRTISLISHASKVMLKVILNRLRPQAEEVIAEEQAGFRKGRSTTEQIFNLRVLSEKYKQQQQEIYHVFVDFKKAFDRVWHDALWSTMKKFNMGQKTIKTIQQLYAKATSAVFIQGEVGDWFHTSVGVRQGCLLSPTLFNILLERIMTDALDDHIGTVSIGGRNITNLRFADDIDGIAGNQAELSNMVSRLDKTSKRYGMEINAEKTKIMTNSGQPLSTKITINGQELETVKKFKYLGAIHSNEGSKTEILARAAQTATALAKLKPVWKDRNISLRCKLKLLHTLVLSIFLYACESWTLTAELQRKITAVEMRCYRRVLGISYKDRVTNEEVRALIIAHRKNYEDLLSIVKRRKLRWYGHVTRGSGLSKTILQGSVQGKRKRGRQHKRWMDNIAEWTGYNFATTQSMAHDRQSWKQLVWKSLVQRPYDPGGG